EPFMVLTTAGEDPLIGDVAGRDILGLTSDNTLVANLTGLEPGDYSVVVRKGDSALGTLLDTDGEGVSLEGLGENGIVLGSENQALVLEAVENALNPAGEDTGLGTVVVGILNPVLDLVNAVGGDVVQAITDALDGNPLIPTEDLDAVLGAITNALLNNTLSLIENTSLSVTLTEHSFADPNAGAVGGNVIDPDDGFDGEPGEDTVDRKSTRLNSSHVKISYAVF